MGWGRHKCSAGGVVGVVCSGVGKVVCVCAVWGGRHGRGWGGGRQAVVWWGGGVWVGWGRGRAVGQGAWGWGWHRQAGTGGKERETDWPVTLMPEPHCHPPVCLPEHETIPPSQSAFIIIQPNPTVPLSVPVSVLFLRELRELPRRVCGVWQAEGVLNEREYREIYIIVQNHVIVQVKIKWHAAAGTCT